MHSIALFVANKSLCEQLAVEVAHSRAFSLNESLGGLALFHADGQSAFATDLNEEQQSYRDLQCLSKCAEETAIRISANGKIAYVETEYFGGEGAQAAIVWDLGAVVYGLCVWQDGTINAALRALGVKAKQGQDEFSTIGFDAVRSNEDFFEAKR